MRKILMEKLAKLISKMTAHQPDQRIQSLVEIESEIGRYLQNSNYADPYRAIADFLRVRSFQQERIRKRGFIDRLLGR